MSDDEHQAMWPQMIAALAAIDEALGLPADGCNSTAQTLAAIRALKTPLTAQQLDKLIAAHVGGAELADGEYSAMVMFATAVERAHGIGAPQPLTWEQAVRSTITDPAVAERILSVPRDATPEQARELLRRPGA